MTYRGRMINTNNSKSKPKGTIEIVNWSGDSAGCRCEMPSACQ